MGHSNARTFRRLKSIYSHNPLPNLNSGNYKTKFKSSLKAKAKSASLFNSSHLIYKNKSHLREKYLFIFSMFNL